jgi:hypothetical protein
MDVDMESDTTQLIARVTRRQKQRYIFLSRRRGMKLEAWVAEHLDKAVAAEMEKELAELKG